MTNILKINGSSRLQNSVSRDLANRAIGRFDHATVVDRDLTQALPVVSEDWVGANFTPKADRTAQQTEQLALSDTLIAELRAADILVMGVPIYNFGVPAALKAWIDLICRVGETFHYTENGPVGLLEGKRAIIAVASGGVPIGSPMDHVTPYLTQVLGFIGITDVTYVAAVGLTGDSETSLNSAYAEIEALNLRAA